jgi:uncharacterized OB-fold protein
VAEILSRRQETLGGYVVHRIPFPNGTDAESLARLKEMTPLTIEQEYKITYLHSYGQDSPWFAALSNKRLLASRDMVSGYTYANPRGHDMYSGRETEWIDITDLPAHIHAFTVCHFGSEEFLPETPFVLALIEFEGVNTLLLTRLAGLDPNQASIEWIGMEVQPRFLRNSKLKPTDVYFVPSNE